MTGAPWACAALLLWHLGAGGALPREVSPQQVRPYATGERAIRIWIFGDADLLFVRAEAGFRVEDGVTGTALAAVAPGALITLRPSRGQIVIAGPGLRVSSREVVLRAAKQDAASVVSARGGWGRRGAYPGDLHVTVDAAGMQTVQQANLESYIAGVLAAEMPASFPLEAMKAQAVAARTYALYHLDDHALDGADLCSRVHCQAYAGSPSPGSRPAEAARQTAGQVLVWNGVLVDALYHSACGGATARAWEVRQGKLLPYLIGSDDKPSWKPEASAYCSRGHDVEWVRRLSWAEAGRLIAANLGTVLGRPGLAPGPLESLALLPADHGARAGWLQVETATGTYRVRGDGIRWLFGTGLAGPGGLRSTALTLNVERDSRGRPRAVIFRGVGHGHGIGLCQWGARGRAESGQSAAEILAAYYPGTVLLDLVRRSDFSGALPLLQQGGLCQEREVDVQLEEMDLLPAA